MFIIISIDGGKRMTQTNLFLGEKQEEKVTELKGKWGKNKHDTILRIIDEYKEL